MRPIAVLATMLALGVAGCGTGEPITPPATEAPATAKTTQATDGYGAKPTTTKPTTTKPTANTPKPNCKAGNAAAASLRASGLVEMNRSVTLMPPEKAGICADLKVHVTWFNVTLGTDGEQYTFGQIATGNERFPGVGDQPAFIDGPEESGCGDTLVVAYVGSPTFPVSELPKVTNLTVTGGLSDRTIAAKYLPAEADC